MTLWLGVGLALVLVTMVVVRDLRHRSSTRRRTQMEDALKHLFDQQYRGRHGSFASLGGLLRVSDRRLMQVLAQMQHQGLVVARGQEFELTPEGERVARQIV